MDFITSIIVTVIGAVLSVLAGWAIRRADERWGLSPELIESFDMWEDKIIDWIMEEAQEAGEDLNIPDTRWEWVNKGIDTFIDYIPMIMQAVGYSKEDLKKDIERYVRKELKEI